MAISETQQLVQKLYIAFYQRPADPAGLTYWADQITANGKAAVINAFATSAEAKALYGTITADNIVTVVNNIYQALFNRDAEVVTAEQAAANPGKGLVVGENYWVSQFKAGAVTPGQIALNVLEGAAGTEDTAVLANKVAYANAYTEQVTASGANYGTGDEQGARDSLKAVTKETAVTPEAVATDVSKVTINDPVTFTVAAGATSVAEATEASFTLKASIAKPIDQTFKVIITGDDKGGTPGVTKADAADFSAVVDVVLPAGAKEVTFAVKPVANDGTEGFQGFKVSLLDSTFTAVATSPVVVITDATTDTTAPVVTAAQTFNYAENQTATGVLATVAATDDVKVTKFEIASGNTDGLFAIDAAGKVTLTAKGLTAAANDFEKAPNQFKLGVVASDAAGNKSAATEVTLNVTNVDDDAPTLVGSSASGTTVRLNFSEALKAAVIANPSAVFTVSQGSTSFSVNSAAISGNVVTLTLATALAAGTASVSYSGTILEDAVGNKVAAIPTTAVTSTDIEAPTLSSSNPADDSTTFGAASNLELTFSETVVAGSGQVKIVNTADATDTRTIDIKDATQVTISGSKLTINPTADLKAGGTYAVNIDTTAVLDTAGNAYAGIANNTTLNFTAAAATPPVTVGQTFTLTTGVDSIPNLVGSAGTTNTDGNDTVLGLYNVNGTTSTFGSADVINSGTGTDILSVTVENATAAVTFPSATVSNVETVNVRNVSGQALTVDTSVLGAALTEFAADRSTATTTLTNLASGVALTVKGDSAAVNEEVLAQFKTASGATALTLNLSGGTNQTTTGKAINIDTTNATGLATVNINSTGATNKFGGIDLNATGLGGNDGTATVSTVNIVAATNLDVSTDGITGLKAGATIKVSGAATDVKLGQLESGFAKNLDASGLTAGGVTATIGTDVTQTLKGGAGNDTITSNGIVLTTGSVDAGAGTGDTLILTTAVATDVAGKAAAALYKNFEVIQVGDAVQQDVSIFSGITGVVINDSSTTATAATNLSAAQAANVTVLAAHSTGAVTIGVKDASVSGQIDTVKILAKPVATAPNTAIDLTGLTLASIEKLELTASTGTATTTVTMTSAADLDSVKLFGAAPASVATGAIAQKINLALDASGMTAQAAAVTTATLDASAATGSNGISFTGSSGKDVITTSSGGNDVVIAGAGNDAITFNGGTDIITGGAGADTVDAGAVATSTASFTLKFAAGDSVSKAGATNGYDATVTDSVTNIDNSGTWVGNSGGKFTIDTVETAGAVSFGTTAITLGTTTVTNAYDFHVYFASSNSEAYVYQDTNGNKVLEAGEFAIKLVGAVAGFDNTGAEFTISTGNLVFTSA